MGHFERYFEGGKIFFNLEIFVINWTLLPSVTGGTVTDEIM
jgi:hypothetical protein